MLPKRNRKRPAHGTLYIRNLRNSVKKEFKKVVREEGHKMADVAEALMLFYVEYSLNPLLLEKLKEVLENRVRINKKKNRTRTGD